MTAAPPTARKALISRLSNSIAATSCDWATTPEKVDELLKDFPGEYGPKPWLPVATTRGNGKDDVFANPLTSLDPGLKTVEGRYAYGLELDGKESNSPRAFDEPDTHEKGIDNELYRTLGCIRTYRSGVNSIATKGRPAYPEFVWELLRNAMPAWLISIDSETGRDGAATVTIDRARGQIKNGVFTTDEAVEMHLNANAYGSAPDMHFRRARLRLALNADGSLRGVIGGNIPWYSIYWSLASRATGSEYNQSQDAVAMYYALRRLADGDPDPATGQNVSISSAYVIEAVPAFIIPRPQPTRGALHVERGRLEGGGTGAPAIYWHVTLP